MITVSRQTGSGGREIAGRLAHTLGYNLLDRDVVERMLVERGFSRSEVEAYDERKPNLWHRFTSDKERYLHFLRLVIYEHASRGESVVLGRGGQVVFAGVPGVLRVRVVAPLADRVSRFGRDYGLEEQRARQEVQSLDNDRAAFYHFLFHTDWDDPVLYDLVVNTHTITPERAADVIKATALSGEFSRKEKEAAARLEQLHLVERATVAILYERNLAVQGLEIEVQPGLLILKGAARDNPTIDRCTDVAADVFGISPEKVDNRISFLPKFAEHLAGVHMGEP